MKTLLASVLAATTVAAQVTGDHMMGGYDGAPIFMILAGVFWIGLILLVWLWVIKLWREIRRKK